MGKKGFDHKGSRSFLSILDMAKKHDIKYYCVKTVAITKLFLFFFFPAGNLKINVQIRLNEKLT